jgi:acyl CoA:acetate/3-ketoacid CoA transferase beta subunit
MEFGDGWIVNLGISIPTVLEFRFRRKEIIFHSENRVISCSPLAAPGSEDRTSSTPAARHLRPGAAIVHHADSLCVDPQRADRRHRPRRLRVAENGDFANWKIPDNRAAARRGDGSGGLRQARLCRDGAPDETASAHAPVGAAPVPLGAPRRQVSACPRFGLFR